MSKRYRFGQPIIFFWKNIFIYFVKYFHIFHHNFLDTLRLPKIYIRFCSSREAKKGITNWINTSIYRCLYPLFQNQSPHFLLSSLFWNLSQIVNKHTVNYQLSYFYGLLRAFLSRVYLEFSPKPVYSTMVGEVSDLVLRLLQIHLWIKKLNRFIFTHASKQNSPPGFYHYPPGRQELFFPEQKEVGEDYGVENYNAQE